MFTSVLFYVSSFHKRNNKCGLDSYGSSIPHYLVKYVVYGYKKTYFNTWALTN